MKRSLLYLLLLFPALFFSCSPEAVEFRRVSSAEVRSFEGNNIEVHADAVLFNPNKYAGKIKDVSIEVFHKEKKLAMVEEFEKSKVKANGESTIPLIINLDADRVNQDILSNLSAIFSARKFDLHYKGNIRVKISGIGYNIPVDYRDELTF